MMLGLPTGAHPGSTRRLQRQINKLKNQVSVLHDKTQDMDRDGFYNGLVFESQVISFQACQPEDDAIWLDTEVVPDLTFLACHPGEGPYPAPTQAELKRFEQFRR